MKQLKQISDYDNLHPKNTIFVVGNGPQLANLTQAQIFQLEKNITIGTNASYLSVESPYYIAGHASAMLLTCHFTSKPANRVFHGEPQYHPFLPEWNVTSIANINIVGPVGYFPKPLGSKGPLVGAENVALSATHLAHIMGVSRIVYIGFE